MYERDDGTNQYISAGDFSPEGGHYRQMLRLRSLLTDDAVVEFRGCRTFMGQDGKDFAKKAIDFFSENGKFAHRRVRGANSLIVITGDMVELSAGKNPDW
jgi:hypothetical protein